MNDVPERPVNADENPGAGRIPLPERTEPHPEVLRLQRQLDRLMAIQMQIWKRQQRRTSLILFVLTFLSTFVVGAQFVPLTWLATYVVPQFGEFLRRYIGPAQLEAQYRQYMTEGLEYAVPLMTILLCHEMGHYLQAVRYRIMASLPYFIPMPLAPLGTMGAVIFQSRQAATRRQMFDIAVSGPIAGLIVTIPVLWYGIRNSEFVPIGASHDFVFGKPLLIQWMELAVHGAAPAGEHLARNPIAFAGWVGVFITAMNLLPVGQLDGGHILYTLIGRKAHFVAYLVIGYGVVMMTVMEYYSYTILIFLLLLSGPRHPPTADDRQPLGLVRHVVGWLTLAFLIVGFTPTPIAVPDPEDDQQTVPTEVSDEFVRFTQPGRIRC